MLLFSAWNQLHNQNKPLRIIILIPLLVWWHKGKIMVINGKPSHSGRGPSFTAYWP